MFHCSNFLLVWSFCPLIFFLLNMTMALSLFMKKKLYTCHIWYILQMFFTAYLLGITACLQRIFCCCIFTLVTWFSIHITAPSCTVTCLQTDYCRIKSLNKIDIYYNIEKKYLAFIETYTLQTNQTIFSELWCSRKFR